MFTFETSTPDGRTAWLLFLDATSDPAFDSKRFPGNSQTLVLLGLSYAGLYDEWLSSTALVEPEIVTLHCLGRRPVARAPALECGLTIFRSGVGTKL